MVKKRTGLAAILAREQEMIKIQNREKYAIEKQTQMKENAKAKRRKQSQQPYSEDKTESYSKAFVPFSQDDKLLLVGEGDFSFAKTIVEAKMIKCLVPTAYDTEEEVYRKYENGKENVEFLRNVNVNLKGSLEDSDQEEYEDHDEDEISEADKKFLNPTPLFTIDATKLHQTKALSQYKFDIILFNFPHIGNGVKDQARNILQHQQLLQSFFHSAHTHSPSATVVVSLFDGLPYSEWKIKMLARSAGYGLTRTAKFDWEHFKGYEHRLTAGRGDTTKEAKSRDSRFYVFEKYDEEKDRNKIEQMKKKRRITEQFKNVKGKKNKKKQYQALSRIGAVSKNRKKNVDDSD